MSSKFEYVDQLGLMRKLNRFYSSEKRRSMYLAVSIFANLFITVSMSRQFKQDYDYAEKLSRTLPYIVALFLCDASAKISIQMVEEGCEGNVPWQKVLRDVSRIVVFLFGVEQAMLGLYAEKLTYSGFIFLCVLRCLSIGGLSLFMAWELFTLSTKKFLKATFGPLAFTLPLFSYMSYQLFSTECIRTIPDASFFEVLLTTYLPLVLLHCSIGRVLAAPLSKTSTSSSVFLMIGAILMWLGMWMQTAITLHADPRALVIDANWHFSKKVNYLFSPLLPFLMEVKHVRALSTFFCHLGTIGVVHGCAVLPRRSMRKIFDEFRMKGKVFVGGYEFSLEASPKQKKNVVAPSDSKFGKTA
eukprot:GDKJ01013444.1.p1 GENE.GDKJ01013444.1~~GDKJ01013444.1.p1  ORF type:complete len:357 (+),score=59.79 GDKJ01013444.1:32-1102(+)